MMIQWFDISGPEPRLFNQERYDNEKQRDKLITRAREDAHNSPSARLWVVDVTSNGVSSFALEDA